MERSSVKIWPNFAPKSRFGLSFEIRISDQHKIAYGHALYPYNVPYTKIRSLAYLLFMLRPIYQYRLMAAKAAILDLGGPNNFQT